MLALSFSGVDDILQCLLCAMDDVGCGSEGRVPVKCSATIGSINIEMPNGGECLCYLVRHLKKKTIFIQNVRHTNDPEGKLGKNLARPCG